MSATPEPERLNQEGFAAFSARTGEDSPVVMLNLLRFKPDGGQERYAEYGVAVTPLLEKAGARVVFLGEAALRTEALEHGELHPMSAADQLP